MSSEWTLGGETFMVIVQNEIAFGHHWWSGNRESGVAVNIKNHS